MLATAASSSSGKPAKKRIAASRNVSIFPRLHSGSYLRDGPARLLFLPTQPIIRYELTDRFTPAGTSDGGALRASVEGRSDDLFRYAEASVHPFVIGAPLLHAPAVREFQVRQTERGADIAAVIDGDFDQSAVTAIVGQSLRQAAWPARR